MPLRTFASLIFFLVLAVAGRAAFAEADPPGRVARVNYSEGSVSFAPLGDNEFTDADFNRPLVRGDKLWTDKGVRAELQVGSAAVRMEGRTQLEVLTLDDQSVQLSVTQGSVYLRVRSLPEGENFEIDTPNLAYRAAYPGDYRIDVDPVRGVTRVTIHSGTGSVYGDKAQAMAMGGGQQITFKGRALAQVNAQEQPPQDNFDRWAAERNRREDQSVAARYVPREVVGYQLLDASGQWQQDAALGVVWIPQSAGANWAPYRNGHWEWIAPWGWTWLDEQPWAFITSHYGRWTQVGSKWAWVPGRMGLRPIYAPALVAFVGSSNGALAASGRSAVAWFPLAPGEAWQPGFRATPLYISSVNANMPPVQQGGSFTFQRKPEALTAVAWDDFVRGKSSKVHAVRVAASSLGVAQVVAPPAMPEHARTAVARAPQPSADIKPAIDNRPATTQQQLEAQKQSQLLAQREPEAHKQQQLQAQAEAQAQAKAKAQQQAQVQVQTQVKAQAQRDQLAKAEQARAAEQARVTEQARVAAEQARRAEQVRVAERQRADQQRHAVEQQKVAELQRLAEQQQRRSERQRVADPQRATQRSADQQQARLAQQQRAAGPSRRDAVAKRTESVRREQLEARREQARRDQLAAVKAKSEQREVQARRAQESKRLAAAAVKKDDEARRIAHAQQMDLARRAADRDAQVLQAQRSEREAALRRVTEEKERAQRDAWQRQQQAMAEQWKRDQQAYEDQQRQKAQQRARPDLRGRPAPSEPEVWQRGVPVLQPGRTS